MSQLPFASITWQNHELICVYYMLNIYHFAFSRTHAQFKPISWPLGKTLGNEVDLMVAYSMMITYSAQEISVILKKKPSINNIESGFIKGISGRSFLDTLPELQLNS